jgi:hypothetical protein
MHERQGKTKPVLRIGGLVAENTGPFKAPCSLQFYLSF